MQYLRKLFLVVCGSLALINLSAAPLLAQLDFTGQPGGPGANKRLHTRAELILPEEISTPGDSIKAGIRLRMDVDWHTYWRNPGDAGMATKVEWKLPPGITAGEIEWPLPEKLVTGDLTTYVYKEEVVLLAPLKLAADLKPGRLNLKANISWLECKELCLPGEQEVSAVLDIGSETKESAHQDLIQEWDGQVPQPTDMVRGYWEAATTNTTRVLILEWISKRQPTEADFFPFQSDKYTVSAQTELLTAEGGTNQLRVTVSRLYPSWPVEVGGHILANFSGFLVANEVKLKIAPLEPAVPPPPVPVVTPSVATVPAATLTPSPVLLWQMLLFAFFGGLILNIMPCVLPVIALKILGFVQQAKDSPQRVRTLGLIYAAGVLVSFLALAALVIGVQAAGHQAGWGMQFRSPTFLVGLTALVTLVALNLFGVFEVTLGGRTLDTASQLAGRHGVAGAFFNGVLATVLATPCTAPFLAPALGYAFTQTAPVIVLFFLTIGVGLALPYVALCWQPGWLRFLPQPGAWLNGFKIAMGVPMLLTAVWLYTVASAYYGQRTPWLMVFLVILTVSAWVFGRFVQRGHRWKGFARLTVLLLLVGGHGYVLEHKLHWRTVPEDRGNIPLQEGAAGIDWQKWSPEAVATARAAGRPVLVDFTAKWCVTCQANSTFALEIQSVREKMKAIKAVALLGDYTKFPDAITTELAKFGRAGVPLVLVYPVDPSQPPQVLPALLTPSTVLEALEKAAGK
jgi:thiol:disulfide interchange protein/DsbC/DsbD-like thiol-disulfide interchange protein